MSPLYYGDCCHHHLKISYSIIFFHFFLFDQKINDHHHQVDNKIKVATSFCWNTNILWQTKCLYESCVKRIFNFFFYFNFLFYVLDDKIWDNDEKRVSLVISLGYWIRFCYCCLCGHRLPKNGVHFDGLKLLIFNLKFKTKFYFYCQNQESWFFSSLLDDTFFLHLLAIFKNVQ